MDSTIPEYQYSPLSQLDNIRLLQLLPRNEDPHNLRCRILECTLLRSSRTRPYEALSYVWGSEDRCLSVIVEQSGNSKAIRHLRVTRNLYVALLHIRDDEIHRTIWVDAICINQTDIKEKEYQIPFMAEIFAQASRVIAWLGEADHDGDRALAAIRFAARKFQGPEDMLVSEARVVQEALLKLLGRPWFRRIWVLQEVAAGMHVDFICGNSEIDGQSFCLGIESLCTILDLSVNLIVFLIRGAMFAREVSTDKNRLSLNICSLGELLDMYHEHQATKIHDKIFALLGMCSDDDLSVAGLVPSYTISWGKLMRSLVQFILGDHASISAWDDKELAVIRAKVRIVGKISSTENIYSQGRQTVQSIFRDSDNGHIRKRLTSWNLQASAKLIQSGDLICFLQGASKPLIIRPCGNHFVIIIIAARPPDYIQTKTGKNSTEWTNLSQSTFTPRDLSLVWDWKASSERLQSMGTYDSSLQAQCQHLEVSKTYLEAQLDAVVDLWNVVLGLGDLQEYERAEEKLQEVMDAYIVPFVQGQNLHLASNQTDLASSSWEAAKFNQKICALLNETIELEAKSKYRTRGLLSWAAEKGHNFVVKLLLDNKAHVDLLDQTKRSPLSYAAANGHEAVVNLLLKSSAEVNSRDKEERTPLSWAAENGHGAVAKLLIAEPMVAVDLSDDSGQTSLLYAVQGGHQHVMELLLGAGANPSLKDFKNRKPLSYAAEHGHTAVLQILLATNGVDVNAEDHNRRTPLSFAAEKGHEVIVHHLLADEGIDFYTTDSRWWTPLSYATENGHEAVVQLLLAAAKPSSFGFFPRNS